MLLSRNLKELESSRALPAALQTPQTWLVSLPIFTASGLGLIPAPDSVFLRGRCSQALYVDADLL